MLKIERFHGKVTQLLLILTLSLLDNSGVNSDNVGASNFLPSAPEYFMLSNATSTTLQASWDPPFVRNGNISGYIVNCTPSGHFIFLPPPTTQTLTGLTPATEYTCTVQASNDNGSGNCSEPATLSTKEDTPEGVSDVELMFDSLSVTNAANGMISVPVTVTWTASSMPNGDITSHNVTIRNSEGTTIFNSGFLAANATDYAQTVTLAPAENYLATVTVTNSADSNATDSSLTMSPQGTPDAVSNLGLMFETNTFDSASRMLTVTATISWSAPAELYGILQGYSVAVTSSSAMSVYTSESVDPMTTSVSNTLMVLPFERYTVTVNATTGGGTSSSSTTVRSPEAVPAAVTDAMLMFDSSSVTNAANGMISVQVTVTWTASSMPNGNISSHNVTIRNSAGTLAFDSGFLAADATDYTQTITLAPAEMHFATVTVTNGAGSSERNSSLAVSSQGTPDAASNLDLIFETSTANFDSASRMLTVTATVSWTAPAELYGILQGYSVAVTSSSGMSVYTNESVDPMTTSVSDTLIVLPFERYTVTVNATTGGGTSSNSRNVTSPEAEPGPVQQLSESVTGPMSITISWNGPLFENGMIVRYEIDISSDSLTATGKGNFTHTELSALSYTADNLSPFTNYTFEVAAITGGGRGEGVSITIPTDESAPSEPMNVAAMSSSNTSITVSWTMPATLNGVIRGYTVTYFVTNSGMSDMTQQNVSATTTQAEIEGLEIFTNYTVFVEAFTVAVGGRSEVITVVTDEGVPTEVRDLMRDDVNATAIMVSFLPPEPANGIITSYEIFYVRWESGSIVGQEGPPRVLDPADFVGEDRITAIILGLEAFTEYRVRVRANTRVGAGGAAVVLVNTDPSASSPPTNFAISEVTSDSVTLTWGFPDMPRGLIEGYVIRYSLSRVIDNSTEVNVTLTAAGDTSSQSQTVRNLLPFTSYQFTVKAYSFNDSSFIHLGEESETLTVTTTEADPAAVTNVVLMFDSSSVSNAANGMISVQVTVTWTASSMPNGNITSHNVTIRNSAGTFMIDRGFLADDATSYSMMISVAPREMYFATVTVRNGAGSSQGNSSVVLSPRGNPVPVSNIVVNFLDDESTFNSSTGYLTVPVNISWTAPGELYGGDLYYYSVSVESSGGMTVYSNTSLDPSLTSVSAILIVRPFQMYTVTVNANISGSISTNSIIVTSPEAAPAPVTNVMLMFNRSLVTNTDNGKILVATTVTWTASSMPNGNITGHGVTIFSSAGYAAFSVSLAPDAVMYSHRIPLDPNEMYRATVWVSNSADSTQANSEFELTPQGTPDAVTNINLMFDTSTRIFNSTSRMLTVSAFINWTAPAELYGVLEQYSVSVISSSGMSVYTNESVDPMTTSVSDTLMVLPFEVYNVTVNATTGGGTSSNSRNVTSPEAASSPPLNLTVTSVEPRSANLSWSAPTYPNGEIQFYSIAITPGMSVNTSDAGTMFMLSPLVPFTKYSVSVRAVSSVVGEMSEIENFTTSEDIPSDVRNLVISYDPDNLTISWDEPAEPNGNISYITSVYCQDLFSNRVLIDSTQRVFSTGLFETLRQPFALCSVTVVPQTGAGNGSSAMMSLQTPEEAPTEVLNLNITSNDTHFTVTWDQPAEPNGNLSYNVSLVQNNLVTMTEVFLESRVVRDTQVIFVSTGLAYTRYTATVIPQTGGGSGPMSTAVFTTSQQTPSDVPEVSVVVLADGIQVMWEEPMFPNGELEYEVTLQQTNLARPDDVIQNRTQVTSDMEFVFSLMVRAYYSYTATVIPFTASPVRGDPTVAFNETEQDTPSDVPSVNVAELMNDIVVTWVKPVFPNGEVQYEVTLQQMNLARPEDVNTFVRVTADLMVTFSEVVRPYHRYSASVVPFTDDPVRGSATEGFIVTAERAPSEVLNLNLTFNDTHFIVTWDQPTEPNGNLSYDVSLVGDSLVTMMQVFSGDSVVRGTQVVFVWTGDAYTLYTATVTPQTGGGPGPISTTNFTTPQQTPSDVRDVNVTEVMNGLLVTWVEPEFPNGVVQYEVTLQQMDLARPENTLSNFDETTSQLEVMFSVDVLPYHRYVVTVVPFTAAPDRGNPTTTSIQTDEAIPSDVETITLRSNGTHIIADWTEPEFPNGNLSYVFNITCYSLLVVEQRIVIVQDMTTRMTTFFYAFAVKYFSRYSITLYPVTGAGAGSTSVTSFDTPPGVPSIPRNLTVTLMNLVLSATWDPPEYPNGIVSYEVNITLTDLATDMMENLGLALSRNDSSRCVMLTVSDERFVRYDVSVRAGTVAGQSEAVVESLITREGPSEAVEDLRAYPSITSVAIEWNPPIDANGIITSYEAVLFTSMGQITNMTVNESVTMVEFTGLMPHVNHSVTVRPFTGNGTIPGDAADVAFFTEVGVPSVPRDVAASPEGMTRTIVVTWTQPLPLNAPTVNYTVLIGIITDMPAVSRSEFMTGFDELRYVVTDLSPFTNYSVSVQACSEAGCGPESEPIFVVTLEEAPSAPLNFTVSTVSGSPYQLQADWTVPENPNGVILNYTVVCNGGSVNQSFGGMELSVRLTDLQPFTQYQCVVYATNNGDRGNNSDPSTARTDEDTPAAVTDVVLMFDSSSVSNAANGRISVSVTVTWTASSMPNGDITSHRVTIQTSVTNTNVYSSNLLDGTATMHTTTIILEPNVMYLAIVEVTNGAGSRQQNSVLSLSPQGNPDAVTNIMFVARTVSFDFSSCTLTISATISWTAPAELYGEFHQYSVSVAGSGGMSVYTNDVMDQLTTSVDATLMVTPFEVYTVTVTVSNSGGRTNSISIIVRSPEAVPAAVANVMLTFDMTSVVNAANGMISVQATVTWTASSKPNGNITSHNVTIQNSEGTTIFDSGFLEADATNYSLSVTLAPAENYFATVTVTNSADSNATNSSLTTSPQGTPDTVSNILFEASSENFDSASRMLTVSATISWTAPAELYGVLEQYSVSVISSSGVSVYTNESVNPMTTSVSDTLMVLPFEVHTVTVNATTGGGTSSTSRDVTSPEAAPGPVQELSVSVTESMSITISWRSPAFENGRIIRYEIGVSSDSSAALGQGNFDHTELSALSYTANNLSPFTSYTFEVVAVTGGGRGEGVSIINQTDEGAPSEPMHVMAMNSSNTSITVSWTVPSTLNGVIRGYTVTYFITNSGMNDMTPRNVSTAATQIEITGLEIFTSYTVFVQAFTVVVGGRSEVITVVTDEGVPDAVTNLQVVDINSTALNVTFDPPSRTNGVLTRYTVSYSPELEMNSVSESIQLEPPVTEVVIANLNSFTRYRVTVVAFTRIGPGNARMSFAVTDPSASSPPTNFMAVTIASNYVELSWDFPEEPRGNIEGYILKYSLTSDQGNPDRVNITLSMDNDNATQMQNVTELLPFHSYTFRVGAYSFGDDFFLHRGMDNTLVITTAQSAPAAVSDVELMFDSSSVTTAANGMISVPVMVTWTASSMPNGNITSHNVTIRNSEGTTIFNSGFLAANATDYTQTVNLAPAENYLATVTVTNGADSRQTDSTLVMAPQGTPDAVGNIELMFDEDTRSFDRASRLLTITATIRWSAPAQLYGVFEQYSVSVASTSTGVSVFNEIIVNQTTTSASDTLMMLPFERYTVTVNVTTGGGTTSESVIVTSPEAAPSPPLNLNSDSVGPRGATISWSPPAFPNGVIRFYTITYSSSNPSETNTANTTGNVTTFMLDSLMPVTPYSVRVRAMNGFVGEDSSLEEFTTAEDIPTNVRNLGINDSDGNIVVSWEEPAELNGNIRYNRTVFCQNLFDNSIVTDETAIVASTGPFQFPRQPYMLCVVTVIPQTGAGPGDSSMESFQTPEEAPTEVLNLNLTFNNSHFIVTWDQPVEPNGNLSYNVSLVGDTLVTMMQVFSGSSVVRDTQAVFVWTGDAYTLYTATVTPQTGEGPGPMSTASFTTPQQRPSDVTNVSVMLLDDGIQVSWSAPSNPNGVVRYNVTLLQENRARPEKMNFTNITSELELVFGVPVLPYHRYTAMVIPFTEAPEKGNVATSFSVNSPQGTPSDVPSVTIAEVDEGIRVTWEEPENPNGEVVYEVTLQTVNLARPEEMIEESTNQTSLLMIVFRVDVRPYHNYSVTIFPFTTASDRGNPTANFYVSPQGTPSEVPRVTVTTDKLMERIIVTWEEPVLLNGVVQYNVSLRPIDLARPEETLESLTRVTMGTSEIFTLTVRPHYNYTATVVPFTNETEQLNGPSTSSSTDTDQEMPERPEMVNAEATSFSTANVTWLPPNASNGIIINYYVAYHPRDQEENIRSVQLGGTSLGVTLTGLNGNTYYILTVLAATVAGQGSSSIPFEFKTLAGPSPPSIVILETLEDERLDVISPKPPAASNGESQPATSNSFQIQFSIIPEMEVNGRVEKFFIFVRPQLSKNNNTSTYYVSSRAPPESAPQYAALETTVDRGNSRKRQANEDLPQSVQIGGSEPCERDTDPCNGPLRPGTSYQVRYRLISESGDATDYPFFAESFSTSNDNTVIIAGSVAVTIVIVILIIILVAVILGILYNRKKTGKMEVSLYADDESRPPLLQPPEDSIVPLETKKSPVAVNSRFQMHSTQANTKKIYIKDFAHHLQSMLDDSGYKFSEEYERVTEIGLDHAKEASLQAENRAKNRYTNILAYDHSRVKLSFVDDEPGSDYINACYIPGHRMRRAYIATQGPLPATFDDFWRMVWEQNSHIIVMLTQLVERGRTKCHRYWPGTEPIVYGDIAVEMLSEKEKEDWTVREFKLSLDEKRHRIVRHFQFTSWPDHGVPDNPIAAVDFVKTVRCFIEPFHGPIVTHCSAGVGRTGCFIALDNLVLHIKDHDWVDIFGLACEMRQHRNHMIQTEAQYIFIHKAMLEIVDSMTSYNRNGTTGSHYSQSGGYPTLFINRYVETEENMTQMSDYYGECLSEETHM